MNLKTKNMKILNNDTYLLLIDEKSRGIEFEEIGVNMRHSKLEVETRNMGGYGSDKYYWSHKKCLAYYPLTKEAEELHLPLLPNPFENNIEELALKEYPDGCDGTDRSATIYRRIFIKGYKAAAQSKQFSLEDMKKAIEMAREIRYSTEEIIQSLSTQQLPKEFIPEYEEVVSAKWGYGSSCDYKLKTTTNSEGKEEIQGTYKY